MLLSTAFHIHQGYKHRSCCSIAGLLSARVCSDHFENVVMIEPEEWVTKTEGVADAHSSPVLQKRSRVPQYNTFHGYQSFTTRVLRKLFRDFDSEVAKAGGRCVTNCLLTDAQYMSFGSY